MNKVKKSHSQFAETQIEIVFDLPFSAEAIFDFIIQPKNMALYEGAFLIPGIAHVESTTIPRKVGTRDFITNSDGSRHQSITLELERPMFYKLHIDKIESSGSKRFLAQLIKGFKEQWILSQEPKKTSIRRSLTIITANTLTSRLFAQFILAPQLKHSFRKHHKNLVSALAKPQILG